MGCPDEFTLWALIEGNVDGATLTSLDAHLDECAECRAVVGAIASGVRTRRSEGSPSDAPTTLGRFEVGDPLGEGAMGVVYGGVDPELARPVALKVLHDAADSAKGRARLVREAQAMARLAHPHVLTVFEVGTDDDTVFIAMERGERNLRVAMGELTTASLVDALMQAGQGLAAAHRAEILHRDFKPENVMLMADGSAKVADFGLAGTGLARTGLAAMGTTGTESSADDAVALTRTGALLGTPLYMAPERLRGEVGDARSDQFSFCVAMWEVIEGRRPFDETHIESLLRAIEAGPQSPRQMATPIATVLWRGLHPDPSRRYASMDMLLASLAAGWDSEATKRRQTPVFAAAAVGALVLGGAWFAFGKAEPSAAPRSAAETGACESLRWPEATGLDGWRGAQVERWRVRWETSRARICGVETTRMETHVPFGQAAACLAAQAEEVARLATPDAPPDVFLHPLDPAACEAGAAAIREELASARTHLRAGDAVAAQEALSHTTEESAERSLIAAHASRQQADFEAAEQQARDALFQAQQDDDRWRVAEAWLALVATAGAAGEYERAARDLAHAEQAVAAVAVMGSGSDGADAQEMDLAGSLFAGSLGEQLLHHQGVVQTQLGDFEGAGRALEDGRRLRANRLGAEAVELSAFHTSLGHLARLEERLADAATHHRAAKALNETLGEDHPRVARDLHNLGGILRRQHRWAEALAHYERSLTIRRQRLGERHPEVALGLNSVGLVFFEMENFSEARRRWEQARVIFLENEHADVAMAEHNLALAHLALGAPNVALTHALSALRRDEERLGPDAKRVGAELVTVAKALVALGRRDEAVTRVTRAKEIATLLGDPQLAVEADAVLRREQSRRRGRGSPGSTTTNAMTTGGDSANSPSTMAIAVESATGASTQEYAGSENEAAELPGITDGASAEPGDEETGAEASEEDTAMDTTVPERPFRAAGSGSYGGGQAWD